VGIAGAWATCSRTDTHPIHRFASHLLVAMEVYDDGTLQRNEREKSLQEIIQWAGRTSGMPPFPSRQCTA
jgi:predicted Ser/Thr protein kinase